MIVDILLQFFISMLIGFISRFKVAMNIFLLVYVGCLIVGLYFYPASVGVSLHNGLFTWWRFIVSIPGFIIGALIAEAVK